MKSLLSEFQRLQKGLDGDAPADLSEDQKRFMAEDKTAQELLVSFRALASVVARHCCILHEVDTVTVAKKSQAGAGGVVV